MTLDEIRAEVERHIASRAVANRWRESLDINEPKDIISVAVQLLAMLDKAVEGLETLRNHQSRWSSSDAVDAYIDKTLAAIYGTKEGE